MTNRTFRPLPVVDFDIGGASGEWVEKPARGRGGTLALFSRSQGALVGT